FRDAFPHAIAMLDEAIDLVSNLDEADEQNYVRRNRQQAQRRLRETGMPPSEAWKQAGYRVFGSPPGTYGAGILQLIDERQWRSVYFARASSTPSGLNPSVVTATKAHSKSQQPSTISSATTRPPRCSTTGCTSRWRARTCSTPRCSNSCSAAIRGPRPTSQTA